VDTSKKRENKMTRKSKGKVHHGKKEGWHKMKVVKARVLVGNKIYRVVEVIDYTESDVRLVVEAPDSIRRMIVAGSYKKLGN